MSNTSIAKIWKWIVKQINTPFSGGVVTVTFIATFFGFGYYSSNYLAAIALEREMLKMTQEANKAYNDLWQDCKMHEVDCKQRTLDSFKEVQKRLKQSGYKK